MSLVEELFREVDAKWKWQSSSRIHLHILGSAALMLQANYERGTKDGDVLETVDFAKETRQRLLDLAGKNTAIHKRRRLYIDIVGNGVPFLPQVPQWHPLDRINPSLDHFELSVLDIVDVVVSKLKRFNADDQSDIAAMIDRDLVPHGALITRFQLGVDYLHGDARAEDLPKYVSNLHRVERDQFGAPETEIELPNWI